MVRARRAGPFCLAITLLLMFTSPAAAQQPRAQRPGLWRPSAKNGRWPSSELEIDEFGRGAGEHLRYAECAKHTQRYRPNQRWFPHQAGTAQLLQRRAVTAQELVRIGRKPAQGHQQGQAEHLGIGNIGGRGRESRGLAGTITSD